MQEIKTLYKISSKLAKTFEQINELCANHLKSIKNNIVYDEESVVQIKTKQLNKTEKKKNLSQEEKQILIDKPKKPMSAYFIFLRQKKNSVSSEYPQLMTVQLAKVMGKLWNSLQSSQKLPYQNQAEIQQEKYKKKMQIFYKKYPNQRPKRLRKIYLAKRTQSCKK